MNDQLARQLSQKMQAIALADLTPVELFLLTYLADNGWLVVNEHEETELGPTFLDKPATVS